MYEYTERVRYSEIDNNGDMTLLGVLNHFQDCSTFHTEDIGYGVDFFMKIRQGWVLNYWQIDFNRRPHFGETVVVATVPYEFKGFLGFRNFCLKNADTGEVYAMANSMWTLIDVDKIRPVRAPQEMMDAYHVGEKIDMEYVDRRTLVFEGEGVPKDDIEVMRHHLDTNNHVNNGRYVEIGMDFLPEDFEVKRLQVEYVKAAVLGDVMHPVVYRGEKTVGILLNDGEGKAYAKLLFTGK